MKYDTSETGWRTILVDYSAALLEKFIQEPNLELGSGTAHKWLMKEGPRETVSRASVIMQLNCMVAMGILKYREQSGKGGYHRLYSLAMTPKEIENFVVSNILQRTRDTWPRAYREVVQVVR